MAVELVISTVVVDGAQVLEGETFELVEGLSIPNAQNVTFDSSAIATVSDTLLQSATESALEAAGAAIVTQATGFTAAVHGTYLLTASLTVTMPTTSLVDGHKITLITDDVATITVSSASHDIDGSASNFTIPAHEAGKWDFIYDDSKSPDNWIVCKSTNVVGGDSY